MNSKLVKVKAFIITSPIIFPLSSNFQFLLGHPNVLPRIVNNTVLSEMIPAVSVGVGWCPASCRSGSRAPETIQSTNGAHRAPVGPYLSFHI